MNSEVPKPSSSHAASQNVKCDGDGRSTLNSERYPTRPALAKCLPPTSVSSSSQSARISRSLISSGSTLTPAEAAWGQFTQSPRRLRTENGGDEDFFSCGYIPPVPTTQCLQHFNIVAGRLKNAEVQLRRKGMLSQREKYALYQQKHQITLKLLREWANTIDRYSIIRQIVCKALKLSPSPTLPSHADLFDMTTYYYPRRCDMKVYICDFGPGVYQKMEMSLGELENNLYFKPEWSDVRWIHAPLSPGLLQSSMEDRFLKGRRDAFNTLGRAPSWPHTEIGTLTFRDRDRLQDMLDVQKLLRQGYSTFLDINDDLDRDALSGLSADLSHDLHWRAQHLGKSLGHWELVRSDFVRQLSSGTAEQPDSALTTHDGLSIDKQMLNTTPLFENAQITRTYFRCFQRADGFLLTMTAPGGVDYIDTNLAEHLRLPSEAQADDEQCSVLGLLFEIFSETGSATWYQRNTDWLLVYILTEVATKPNNYRMGCNAPGLMRTYQGIVQELKAKRYDEFKRQASVALVRDYLTCIDEITTLVGIFKNSNALMQRLKDKLGDLNKGERTITPDNEHGESAMSRVEWAVGIIDNNALIAEELLEDLHISLNALFQLRSIEQNELAIVADSQNKAILVFTGVTIIFLPLSFFTSYFGMNLKGVVDSSKSELYFWKLCGTLGFGFILIVALYAFKHRLRTKLDSMLKIKVGNHLPT